MDMDCVVAGGGNKNLINGDEAAPRAECVTDVPMVVLPGGSDDFSHVNPMFRESQ
jgi:hypothetical protein